MLASMHQLRKDLNKKAFCAWRYCDSITYVALPQIVDPFPFRGGAFADDSPERNTLA
jgi:hypothetical protein